MTLNEDSSIKLLIQMYKEEINLILSSIANERRLEILSLIYKTPAEFNEIQKIVGLGKTALSHHLRNLVDNGLTKQSHRGVYEISQDGIIMLDAISAGFRKTRKRKELVILHKANSIRKIHSKESESKMQDIEIKIVKLDPMIVASVRVISSSPENDAWAKIKPWAIKKGLLDDLEKHPVFGFNNPDPQEGKKEYGYEFWIKIDKNIDSDDTVNVKNFTGGQYAVKSCNLTKEANSDYTKKHGKLESWVILKEWVDNRKLQYGDHPWLEKSTNAGSTGEDAMLDLYFPIKESK